MQTKGPLLDMQINGSITQVTNDTCDAYFR